MLSSRGGDADVSPEDEWWPEGKERGEVAGAAYINPPGSPETPSRQRRDLFQGRNQLVLGV